MSGEEIAWLGPALALTAAGALFGFFVIHVVFAYLYSRGRIR